MFESGRNQGVSYVIIDIDGVARICGLERTRDSH